MHLLSGSLIIRIINIFYSKIVNFVKAQGQRRNWNGSILQYGSIGKLVPRAQGKLYAYFNFDDNAEIRQKLLFYFGRLFPTKYPLAHAN